MSKDHKAEDTSLLRILVDRREQLAYDFQGYSCLIEPATLATGDYTISGLESEISIERKTLQDIVRCLGRDRTRFENELARSVSLNFFAIVVEAGFQDLRGGQYRSQLKPHSACQSLLDFAIRYKAQVFFADSRKYGEYITYSLLQKYHRERTKGPVVSEGDPLVRNHEPLVDPFLDDCNKEVLLPQK